MRKLIIGLAAMGVVALGFWMYIQIMDPPVVEVQSTADVEDMVMPETTIQPQQQGQINVAGGEEAEYIVVNPETKEVERIMGFAKLLNPGESIWHVEKPYLIFRESRYQCRIESETGVFQGGDSMRQAAPKDARLAGKVVIHIEPTGDSRMSETFIYMDDLAFSGERSEFATDGPVEIVSDQIQMDGYGLVMIFDTQDGRIDYLNIRDLEQLRLKNFATSESSFGGSSESDATSADSKTNVVDTKPTQQAVAKLDSADSQTTAETKPKNGKPSDYYQCLIEDNVLIRYGDELIVAGADQVNIKNILFKQSQESLFGGDSEETSDSVEAGDESKGQAVVADAGDGAESPVEADADQEATAKEGKDILVTCDGGIIIKPVDGVINVQTDGNEPELAMEMSGAPLRIERCLPETTDQFETMARCGLLTYTPKDDILRMFTDSQRQIVLNAQDSQNRIETEGSIFWNRKTQQANVAGPGKVYLHDSTDPTKQPSEVEFAGMMDLLFASLPNDASSATIQTINLTGGMNATLKQNGWYKTTADRAKLDFGPENSLSHARLLGGVEFKSLAEDKPQRAVSETATFNFGPENSLNTAHMDGGVLFESRDNNKESRALADRAVFHFTDNKIQVADLKGAVSFASDTGRLTATDAQIEFKPDASGSMQPGVVHTTGQSVLQTITDSPDKLPAKFEAQKIDYDLQTGSGLAYGPIRFTFYQPADEESTAVEANVPVTITADDNAEFLADAGGNINQVVFNGNVVAARTFKTLKYEQQDNLHGEQLIVNIADNLQGKPDVSSIVIKEGNVFAKSLRQGGGQVLSNMTLKCQEIHYGRLEDMILAKGPGTIELVNNEQQAGTAGAADKNMLNGEVDFQRPCVARVKDFKTIELNLAAQQILADGQDNTMDVAYVPLLDGKPEKYIYFSTPQITASFHDDVNGRPAIKHIFTDKGISFTERGPSNRDIVNYVTGQTLKYDAVGNDWLQIIGSEARPCIVNTTRVREAFINLNTGDVKTKLSSQPGIYRSPIRKK